MLAKQAAVLMIENFRAYALAPDVGRLAQERIRNDRIDSLVIFQLFDELQKGQHSSLSKARKEFSLEGTQDSRLLPASCQNPSMFFLRQGICVLLQVSSS